MYIPIESIISLVTFLVLLAGAYRLYFSYKRNPESENLLYFFYTFVCASFFFLASSLPGLVFKDPFLLSGLSVGGRVFLMSSAVLFTTISLRIMRLGGISKIYSYLMVIIILLSTSFSFAGIEEKESEVVGGFEYWTQSAEGFSFYGMILFHVLLLLSFGFCALAYLYIASKNRKNKLVFTRSIILGTGSLFFLLGNSGRYFIREVGPLPSGVFSGAIIILGAVLLVSSIFYKKEN